MTQDTYRFAYEEATAELGDIVAQFERLSQRKAQMEQIMDALKPLLMEMPQGAAATDRQTIEVAPFLVQQATEPAAEPVAVVAEESYAEPEYAEQASDPFQRRIDNALRQGFGGRDSRVLSLGLNSLLTRA
jgi:hypothetical protein